jgi:hypothetical protein
LVATVLGYHLTPTTWKNCTLLNTFGTLRNSSWSYTIHIMHCNNQWYISNVTCVSYILPSGSIITNDNLGKCESDPGGFFK